MSLIVPIQSIPNEEFSINLENVRYDIALKSTATSALATVSINDAMIIENVRAVGGTPLLPYEYMEGIGGNFIFDTPNQQIPYYENYGITQFLVYLTAAEMEAARES